VKGRNASAMVGASCKLAMIATEQSGIIWRDYGRGLEATRECCRCGACCASAICKRGMERLAWHESEKNQRCHFLAFESDGSASCGLFERAGDTSDNRRAFGIGAGCCFAARVRDVGGAWHSFATLPDAVKMELAKRMMAQ
jgi:hypothetical protein